MVTSIYGMGIVLGPILGPTVGGLLAELYGWRWAFYMIVPVGLLSTVGLKVALQRDPPAGRINRDIVQAVDPYHFGWEIDQLGPDLIL